MNRRLKSYSEHDASYQHYHIKRLCILSSERRNSRNTVVESQTREQARKPCVQNDCRIAQATNVPIEETIHKIHLTRKQNAAEMSDGSIRFLAGAECIICSGIHFPLCVNRVQGRGWRFAISRLWMFRPLAFWRYN